MIQLQLKNIILNNDFGPLKIGANQKEVIEILGEPTDFHDDKNGIVFFLYGWYEFSFFDDYFHYFQNDHVKADCSNHDEMIQFKNENLELDTWFLKNHQDITLKEVIPILKKEKADFIIRNQQGTGGEELRVGETKWIEIAKGCTLDFENQTTLFEYDTQGEIINSKDVMIQNEMDFVLNGIRFESFNLG